MVLEKSRCNPEVSFARKSLVQDVVRSISNGSSKSSTSTRSNSSSSNIATNIPPTSYNKQFRRLCKNGSFRQATTDSLRSLFVVPATQFAVVGNKGNIHEALSPADAVGRCQTEPCGVDARCTIPTLDRNRVTHDNARQGSGTFYVRIPKKKKRQCVGGEQAMTKVVFIKLLY